MADVERQSRSLQRSRSLFRQGNDSEQHTGCWRASPSSKASRSLFRQGNDSEVRLLSRLRRLLWRSRLDPFFVRAMTRSSVSWRILQVSLAVSLDPFFVRAMTRR